MQLIFDSIEEVQDFVKKLKGTRGGKADKEDAAEVQAPAPLAPPVNPTPGPAMGFPGGGAAPGAGAGPVGGAFPAPAAPVMAPEVQALVTRIVSRTDAAIQGGQPEASVLQWFRGECGKVDPSAANASLDQIKTVFLPKLGVPQLEGIAKLMSA